MVSWAGDIKEYALQQAVSKEWKDWKLVEGRSNRKYVNETVVAETVKDAGYDPYEHKVLSITAMTKLLGKAKFEELLSAFTHKPQGKPTLVPMSDKCPAMNTARTILRRTNNMSKNYTNPTKVITEKHPLVLCKCVGCEIHQRHGTEVQCEPYHSEG